MEGDPENPIDIGPFGEDLGQAIREYPQKADPLDDWRVLSESLRTYGLAVLESRFLQNAPMFGYLCGWGRDQAIDHTLAIESQIRDADPLVVLLRVPDVESHFRFVMHAEHPEWIERVTRAFDSTHWLRARGVSGVAGFVEFFCEWAEILDAIVARLSIGVLVVDDPHANRSAAVDAILARLGAPIG